MSQPFSITTNTIPALPPPSLTASNINNINTNVAPIENNNNVAPVENEVKPTTTTPTREGSASKRRKVGELIFF